MVETSGIDVCNKRGMIVRKYRETRRINVGFYIHSLEETGPGRDIPNFCKIWDLE